MCWPCALLTPVQSLAPHMVPCVPPGVRPVGSRHHVFRGGFPCSSVTAQDNGSFELMLCVAGFQACPTDHCRETLLPLDPGSLHGSAEPQAGSGRPALPWCQGHYRHSGQLPAALRRGPPEGRASLGHRHSLGVSEPRWWAGVWRGWPCDGVTLRGLKPTEGRSFPQVELLDKMVTEKAGFNRWVQKPVASPAGGGLGPPTPF